MSNSDEVKAALTASEWEDCETVWPVVALSTTRGGDLTVWDGDTDDDSMHVRVPDEYRHALAALALYQQPFGFTREDVDRLRAFAIRDSRTHGPHETHWAWHLADRIAALLPPEPTDG